MSTKPEAYLKRTKVTGQRFVAYHPQPENGRGFINFAFEDNRKNCLGKNGDTLCWTASLTMKAFSGEGDKPDPDKDLLLMEATIELETQFGVNAGEPETSAESLAWYFDDVSKQKLLGKMRLLLLGTEFSRIPLPGNVEPF